MPDVHLGAVDRARHDSVDVHSVSLRYLVVTQKTGCKSHTTEFCAWAVKAAGVAVRGQSKLQGWDPIAPKCAHY